MKILIVHYVFDLSLSIKVTQCIVSKSWLLALKQQIKKTIKHMRNFLATFENLTISPTVFLQRANLRWFNLEKM